MRKQKRPFGQSLIEFALVLPLLLLLVMGLFEIGRFVLYYAVLNTAVREGTRFAIVQSYSAYVTEDCPATDETNIEVCKVITGKYFNIGELQSSRISISHEDNTYGDPIVNISIEFDYEPNTPGLGLIGDFTINVDSQMLMTPLAKL